MTLWAKDKCCLLSLGAEHSFSKREVAGPIPAESLKMVVTMRKVLILPFCANRTSWLKACAKRFMQICVSEPFWASAEYEEPSNIQVTALVRKRRWESELENMLVWTQQELVKGLCKMIYTHFMSVNKSILIICSTWGALENRSHSMRINACENVSSDVGVVVFEINHPSYDPLSKR